MKALVSTSHGLGASWLVMICLWCIEDSMQATAQQLELPQHLKQFNKPVVKSIKSPDGDIIDCVHISHQPVFDHPLLKNHTIQMRPSFRPLGLYDQNKVTLKKETSSIHQLWHQNGRCPKDTIPIRRIKKDDAVRASSIERYEKMHMTIPYPTGSERAGVYVALDPYYGGKATMNVWNPKVQTTEEFSASQLWLVGTNYLNTIKAGWHVYPSLYKDNKTRLFAFWASDKEYTTGCWNLNCPGFVQVDKDIALGAAIDPISTYGGQQYEITILIFKDPTTNNWWLAYGSQIPLGYWPGSLLPNLYDGAYVVQWGGEVVNSKQNGQHTTTEMGSGQFPVEGYGKASYFKNVQKVLKGNVLADPDDIEVDDAHANCYAVRNDNNDKWGYYFYYGGPGRSTKCAP